MCYQVSPLTSSSQRVLKMLSQCEGYITFQNIKHQLQEIILRHYIHWSFP